MTRRTFLTATAAATAATPPSSSDLPATLTEAIRWIRQRKVSPEELTRATIARIERLNPQLNAFITVIPDARPAAGAANGPLYGVPVAVKDLFDTAGIRTTAASAHWAGRIPPRDAVVVDRLRRAGAILVGKLNMDEFAYNFTSSTSHFGVIRNPWNRDRIPGGSSGGSAVAIAAGMCTATLGSDTGGSIRCPAALCGITGFKPSYGAVSAEGGAPLAWSLDHVGPMTRSAEDAALVFHVIRNDRAAAPRPMKTVRVGIPRGTFFEQLEPDVATAIEAAIGALGKITAGAAARDVKLPALHPFPGLPMLPKAYGVVITAEAHAFHHDMLARNPTLYHPATRRSIENGKGVTVPEYLAARQEMERLRAEAAATLFAAADILALPTCPGVAFPFEQTPDLVFLRNTAPWNLYGLPAISIPCGLSRDGLPIGLQLVGPHGADDTVLAVARAYQRVTDWHTRRPAGW